MFLPCAHCCALSCVAQKPFQIWRPTVSSNTWESPLTKLAVSHDVCTEHPANILWTTGLARYPGKGSKLNLNHFVPLVSVTCVQDKCTESLSAEPITMTTQTDDDVPMENNDSSCDDLPCPMVMGEPLKKCFLLITECQAYLDDHSAQGSIPNGVKEYTWLKINGSILMYWV